MTVVLNNHSYNNERNGSGITAAGSSRLAAT